MRKILGLVILILLASRQTVPAEPAPKPPSSGAQPLVTAETASGPRRSVEDVIPLTMAGMRKKAFRAARAVTVTTIEPGYVDTRMAQGDGMFWVAAPRRAAEQIYDAIRKKKKHAYITRRWRLVAWFFKVLPEFVYNRL